MVFQLSLFFNIKRNWLVWNSKSYIMLLLERLFCWQCLVSINQALRIATFKQQQIIWKYHFLVPTFTQHNAISMSHRSTPPICLLCWWIMLRQDTFIIALSFADQRFMSSPTSGPIKEKMDGLHLTFVYPTHHGNIRINIC